MLSRRFVRALRRWQNGNPKECGCSSKNTAKLNGDAPHHDICSKTQRPPPSVDLQKPSVSKDRPESHKTSDDPNCLYCIKRLWNILLKHLLRVLSSSRPYQAQNKWKRHKLGNKITNCMQRSSKVFLFVTCLYSSNACYFIANGTLCCINFTRSDSTWWK